MKIFYSFSCLNGDKGRVNCVAELVSIVTTKPKEAAVGRPPKCRQEWVFPSGNFWLLFMILAILQSDYFVFFGFFFCYF